MSLSSEGDAPYNVYAKQLLTMRQGYPLWRPEIERDHGLEVQVGDVGYLHEGAFIRIFNALLPGDHEDHKIFGVPRGHEPFPVNRFLWREHTSVIESHLCSRSVNSFGLEGRVAIPAQPVGAGMKFQCSDEQGAFVFMNIPAAKTQMLPSHNLAPFIRHRIDGWHEHVQRQLDLQIARDQLIFVSGVVKTEDWGLGAFMSHAKGGEVAFSAQVPFFQGTFSVQSRCAQTGNIQYRAKPLADDGDASASPSPIRSPRPSISLDLEGPGSGEEAEAEASSEEPAGGLAQGLAGTSLSSLATPTKRDQTLFIHYYKMKARWWMKRIIKAAAGPDERDPDRSGDGELEDMASGLQVESDDSEGEAVQEPPIDQTYDPVDYLLDYILEYPLEDGTEVQVAIASDLHIYALFDGEIPLDIKERLEKLRPLVIFMDDNREVACLAIAEWAQELPEGDSDDAESKVAGKQKENVPNAHAAPLLSSPQSRSMFKLASPAAYASLYPASPPRPFACDMCALSFNRQHDLKRHRDTHTREEPFCCNGRCGKTFTRKDALKRHQLVKRCGIDDDIESYTTGQTENLEGGYAVDTEEECATSATPRMSGNRLAKL